MEFVQQRCAGLAVSGEDKHRINEGVMQMPSSRSMDIDNLSINSAVIVVTRLGCHVAGSGEGA